MHVEHSYLGWFLDEGRHYSSEMVKLKLFPYQKTDVELSPLSSSCFLSLSRACLNQNKSLSPITSVKVKVLAIQSCPTLGFLGQQYQVGCHYPFPGDIPDPGIKPRSPALQADSLSPEPPGKALTLIDLN